MAGKTFPGGESGWQRVDSGGPFREHIPRPKRLGDMSDDRAEIRDANVSDEGKSSKSRELGDAVAGNDPSVRRLLYPVDYTVLPSNSEEIDREPVRDVRCQSMA